MRRIPPDVVQQALRILRRKDRILAKVIKTWGPADIRLRPNRFEMLVRSILSQQISGAAARTIQKRLRELAGPFRAESISALSLDQLRSAGISRQKGTYLLDLAQKSANGEIRFRRHRRMTDDEVIDDLVQVKGIGRWTAQMYLMFSLGRLDVFPEDDLGVRSAIRNLYGFDQLPSKEESREVAERWRPYASIAVWYCWRSLETPET